MAVVFGYEQGFDAGINLIGAKAWNMSRLARWGFPVPAGVAVSTKIYDRILKQPSVARLLITAKETQITKISDTKTTALLKALRAEIEAQEFSNTQKKELQRELVKAGISQCPIAVRSSATGEDSEAYSFAGVHQSFLNVEGLVNIEQAIRKCLASLWTPQAIAYRRQFNLEDSEVRGAVLICKMVSAPNENQPRVAGIAFSSDPTNGRRDTLLIEMVPGMGDKLVSGHITPTSLKVHMRLDGFEYGRSIDLPLPQEAIEQLILQIWRIHWAFSDGENPQDIEWAWDGSDLFILQTRPVTTMPRRFFPSLKDQKEIWTNANFKEVLSGILSPMGWCPAPQYTAHHFFSLHHLSGYNEPKGMQVIRRFEGRAYVDASIIQYSAFDAWGILPAETNRSFGGFQPEIDIATDRKIAWRTKLRQGIALMKIMHAAWRGPKTLPTHFEDMEARAKNFTQQNLSSFSDRQLMEKLFSLNSPQWQPDFMLANMIGSMWIGIARQIAEKAILADEREPLIAGLMSGRGGVVSAQHAYELHTIIKQHGTSGAEFEKAIDQWLEEYGHRGYNEFDIASPRWREQRQQVVQMAKSLPQASHTPDTAQNVYRNAENKLRKLPLFTRKKLGWAVRRAAQGFKLRENGKSALIAVHGMSRHIVLEFGERLRSARILDKSEDVFMLTLADLWAYSTGVWEGAGARNLVEDRRKQIEIWAAGDPPPDVILSNADQLEPTKQPIKHQGPTLIGMGVSPGQSQGRARKIHDPIKPGALSEGGILVARSTDPSWTPLFLSAQGIVVETGGYLSHGAIVAREFGLPAVVNAPDCFDTIPEGCDLYVDGDQGRVTMK